MSYCPQCGHDTLMQQEENEPLYLCGFCGHKEYRCSECGGEMHTVAESGYGLSIRCKNCGHEEELTEGKK